jgi:ribosomal protein S18 acetylase RimI-like enzyme
MTPSMRRCRGEDDYWHVRQFLRDVYLLNGRRELSWQTYRLDYWRWHVVKNLGYGSLQEGLFLWETDGGRIVAVLNPEAPHEAFLQVHPGHRSPELEDEMLAVAEEHLAVPGPEGERYRCIWAHEGDSLRASVLSKRGYRRGSDAECQRRLSLSAPLPDAALAAGYTVRSLGAAEELPARSWASWRAFHPHEPDDQYRGWEWYTNIQRSPMYRRDLDLVVVAPDGQIASFCTIWFDDVTRTGAFEPVGTVPEHQRRGLASAAMVEGLRRLQRLGATQATVSSFTAPAHTLYASVGFMEYDLSEAWVKRDRQLPLS